MKLNKKRLSLLLFILIYVFTSSLWAKTDKKVLTLEDYPRWKHIISTSISSDGNWISYALRPNGGDPTLYIKSLVSDKIYETPNGSQPTFSKNSQWVAYMIGQTKKESEKLKKEKKPVPTQAELLNLSTGDKFTVENTSSFSFSEDSKYFAVRQAKSDKNSEHQGTNLILFNLKNGQVINFGNVSEFKFNKPGTMLAHTVDAADKKGNGIYLMKLKTEVLKPLDTGEADYARISWNKEGTALAVLKGIKKENFTQKENTLLVFIGLDKDSPGKIEYNPSDDPSFPENMVISEKVLPERRRRSPAQTTKNKCLSWSEDNSRIFCGIKKQKKELKKIDEPVANVDVWHWKDERIQSVQIRQAEYDLNFSYKSVFLLEEKRFVRLADEKMRTITIAKNGKWGIGQDKEPYLSDVETMQADYYLVNTSTGESKLIVKGIRRPMGLSPDSQYFLFLKNKQLWVYDIKEAETKNISEEAPVSFVNQEDDHPYEKPAYGIAGWSKDGKTVIVNHRYDLWSLSLENGTPKNITGGMGDQEQIRFRYTQLDPEERFIDTSQPLLLSAYGEWTKKSGYYSLKIGTEPKELIYEDKKVGFPIKAKNADKIMYTMETFVDFPNYYVSGTDFKNPEKITEANPQQKEYAWGKRILIDYKNSNGVDLQATLTLPANYKEKEKYPMLVYFYEKMSQRHHQYSMPTYDDRPHMSAYASDGYLVLMPDVVYTIGKPGSSALDCVSSAVKKVIELGYADPDHIGLQGHSWGGYESAFIVTQTDLFACVVAGAAPSCPAIEYNQIFKSSGYNNHSYYERSQGRMGTDPWKNFELYCTQSPIRQAPKITTPFMLLHGTEDGSVDWIESLEYYNAARRLGKEVIFLSYPGEPHHLSKEENQKDFQIRMKQYFDHYLKGSLMPDWMENGVTYLEKKRKLDASKEEN
jgi:dipeptidyl aminopeptidase/acylaminoacyl peptidase